MIFGDGEQSRDFTFVDDAVALNQAWELLQKIEGVTIPSKYGPPREGDVRDSQADTTAARRDLGHEPQFTFEQGMRTTLEWYRLNAFSPETVSIG